MPIPRHSDRRSPCNKFHAVAPFITADANRLVFIGRSGARYAEVKRRFPDVPAHFATWHEAYRFARDVLVQEMDRAGLPRTRRGQERMARKATAPAAGIGAYEANSEARQILYPAVGWLRRMRSMPEEVRSATPATH